MTTSLFPNDLQAMATGCELSFRAWSHSFYAERGWLNQAVEKECLREAFLGEYPQYRMLFDFKSLRRLLSIFCDDRGYHFNPHRHGKPDRRDKSNGREYYTVADSRFDAAHIRRVQSISE